MVSIKTKRNGTGIILNWECDRKHVSHSWRSQPVIRGGALLGNIKMAGAILLSGNNYQKVALLCKFLNLGLVSSYSFHQIQSHYVVPSVEKLWEKVKGTAQEELRANNVVVAGDGRMDSPGHCAKYCTYTVMDQASKKIIAMEIVDKRECELHSGRMEAAAFERVLADIQNAGLHVSEFVTDAHPQIAAIMRKKFQHIRHSWDMWHGAKNLGKKLCAVSQEKGNAALKPWISSVTNHFYYAAENCESSEMRLKIKLAQILNHCADKHKWMLGQCDHGELDEASRNKEWLNPGGPELLALERVLFNARFLSTMRYYVTCQTTSELESFNSHLLMYAAKRQSFTYGVYKARCQLAAIDYMMHLERPYKTNKKGEQYYNRAFSKATNQWVVKPVKEKKQYSYIPELLLDVIVSYCAGSKKLRDPVEKAPSDPIHVAQTIAPKQPPQTKELVEKQEPRLRLKAGTSKETLD